MNKLTHTLSLAALTAISATAAHAVAVPSTVSTTPGSDFSASAMETSISTGATMDGMVVTVSFADHTTSTGIWAATGGFGGQAFADGWSLAVTGSTYSNPWILSNTGSRGMIVGFSIDAAPANVGFDIVASPDLTPNSDPGRAFNNVTDSMGSVTAADALYSNRLLVGGSFYGDMYEMLTVGFTGGLQADGVLQFLADTDNATGRIVVSSVPEPETYALMLAGLGIVASVARRRRG